MTLPYNFRYYFTHPHLFIKDVWRKLRHFIQRGLYGYDETSWYYLCDYLTDIIIPNLEKLIKYNHGTPVSFLIDLYGDKYYNTIGKRITKEYKKMSREGHKKWEECLNEMLIGFKARNKARDHNVKNPKEYEELDKLYKKGLELFVKYYDGLWD